VGTGPFIFKDWVKDDRITLSANPNYFMGKPGVDQVVARTIKDNSARIAALKAGEVHVADNIGPDDLGPIKSDANLQAVMRGYNEVFEVPQETIEAQPTQPARPIQVVRRGARVSDVMHQGVITCGPNTPIDDVARRMTEHGISALVVVDQDGFAQGIVSTSDLANAGFVAPEVEFEGLSARHLMTSPVIATRPDQPLSDAVKLLREKRVHRLVVVDPADVDHMKPVGILSVTDLVRTLGELEPASR
jgi:CBS domain-containing protein